ncbi:hypothetical protein CTEN210_09642 [Chaetoceros tenuissimus]|uniref:Potassium channel tetramerisation-type BTB domain-containing protein n=1 Tax=Chaetoceros tenuissimus TaxID=426638 RepID=A0AAD3CXW4_9STRA|nr:hypothetical protein CTEN210_09642 [Chaetoceros tenuissimus]
MSEIVDLDQRGTSIDPMKKRERDRDLAEQQKRGKTDLTETHEHDDIKPIDVLHLNIGGKRLDVLRRTLCSIESSMLASRFSGRWDDSLKDEKGHFFINEEYTLFKAMVDYLRKKETETDLYPAKPPDDLVFSKFDGGFTKHDFYRMLDYYGMLFQIYPVRLRGAYSPEDTQNRNFSMWCKH